MSFDACKLCAQVKRLVKAHIIPRSFNLRSKGHSTHLIEARQNDDRDVQNWQNGIWDDHILCEACENSFSTWDGYGFQILGNPPGSTSLPRDDTEVQKFVINDIDYDQFKLFALSLLWRASVSSLPFFSKIRLGAHEAIIADMIRNKDSGSYDQFAVILARLVDQRFPNIMIAPYQQRTPEGIKFCILSLPSVKLMIKVDQRSVLQALQIVLRDQHENIALPLRLHENDNAAIRREPKA